VLAAREIMRLYREDQPQLARNVALQADSDSAEETFYPPATRVTFRDSEGLRDALASGELVSIPSGDAYGFEITPDVGALTRQRVDIGRGLYKTLTPAARATLLYLAARVQVITGAGGPKDNLLLTAATRDEEYERALGIEPSDFTLHTTGNSFDFKRKYRNDEQALAFQFVLDRLSALGVIAYTKVNDTIHVTVSPRADALLGDIEE